MKKVSVQSIQILNKGKYISTLFQYKEKNPPNYFLQAYFKSLATYLISPPTSKLKFWILYSVSKYTHTQRQCIRSRLFAFYFHTDLPAKA